MAAGAVISSIRPNSKAARAGLAPGDRIVKVNNEPVNDLIDMSFAMSDEILLLEIEKQSGKTTQVRIRKSLDESIGIEFESAVFDRVRTCANKCLFCFVDQMPPGMRESLYVKDDDYRLSFLYGNFVTLTNLTVADFKRIRQFHLSPLYVSVHTTDGELRKRLLGTPRAARIMQQLRDFINAGIEIHTQVVLCPGYNDGEALARTIWDLSSLGSGVLSLAIVPIGLTRFREYCHPMRTFTAAEAASIIDQVSQFQSDFRKDSGRSFVYLSDEFYIRAGRAIPPEEYYDGYPQLENGIGLVRSFLSEWDAAGGCPRAASNAKKHDGETMIVSGAAFAPVLAKLTDPLSPAVQVKAVVNDFFGEAVNVSGLLTGSDITAQVKASGIRPNRIIIPSTTLRKNEPIFLDGMSLEQMQLELSAEIRVAAGAAELRDYLTSGGEEKHE